MFHWGRITVSLWLLRSAVAKKGLQRFSAIVFHVKMYQDDFLAFFSKIANAGIQRPSRGSLHFKQTGHVSIFLTHE